MGKEIAFSNRGKICKEAQLKTGLRFGLLKICVMKEYKKNEREVNGKTPFNLVAIMPLYAQTIVPSCSF